ncbi:HTH-type transcriptional repressor Bm3R1 [Thomasclavelia ramosa]|uniref:TetR/AcrR family transcriptional regulator n=1 Tax=Thomasclavelia ramosa TaxID=1547 RepID=UPI00106CB01D|nr:TetR/AcrR family transcriptional regulator [Thomasclavelia ramosa]VEU15934.1 HTH-type transcriptional repressor Bm3R1 [Thomasclavelia ramosa]
MNKKDIILKNALIIFNENGYVGTSINDVAKKSGIAKSTIFHYFKNKEDLFNQVFLKSKIAFAKTNTHFLFGTDRDELIEILEFQNKHIEELKFFNQFEYSKYISEDSKRIAQKIHEETINYIKNEQKNNRMVDLDPTFICMFITNTFVSNYNRIFVNGKIDFDYALKLKSFIEKALVI